MSQKVTDMSNESNVKNKSESNASAKLQDQDINSCQLEWDTKFEMNNSGKVPQTTVNALTVKKCPTVTVDHLESGRLSVSDSQTVKCPKENGKQRKKQEIDFPGDKDNPSTLSFYERYSYQVKLNKHITSEINSSECKFYYGKTYLDYFYRRQKFKNFIPYIV